MEMKLIGSKIAEARKEMKLSQGQLAEHLFISSQAVGKWERGESMPDITTFNRLAEVLGVDLNYFSENFKSNNEDLASNSRVPSADSLSEVKDEKTPQKWNMSKSNWIGADFSGLKNLNEKFSSSNIKNCKFVNSDLSGLLLIKNYVEGCDFSNSNLNNSQIHNSALSKTNFKDASLVKLDFSESSLKDCDFTNADFTGTSVKCCTLIKSTLTNSILEDISFVETGFNDIVFESMIKNCSFEKCGFNNKVKFENATLLNTFFKNNNKLKNVQFINCKADDITYAFLKNENADLTGVSLIKD